VNSRKKYALVCPPAKTVANAVRMKHRGEVDYEKATLQHKSYCNVLSSFGYSLITLPLNDGYPDSTFVEDPAIIIENILVVTRLRHPKRQGEEELIENALKPYFSGVFRIEPPGFIEGGDVLITNGHLYIGLSKRTNEDGAEQLAKLVKDNLLYEATIFEIPETYLHLKGEATYHRAECACREDFITVSEEIYPHFYRPWQKFVVTPAEERFGGNNISNNGLIFIHKGRKKTKKILEKEGLITKEIDLSEFEKIDGAMTCLSKLFYA